MNIDMAIFAVLATAGYALYTWKFDGDYGDTDMLERKTYLVEADGR